MVKFGNKFDYFIKNVIIYIGGLNSRLIGTMDKIILKLLNELTIFDKLPSLKSQLDLMNHLNENLSALLSR